ncbi:arylsulfatase B [Flammeovirga kamogawensis]|uniref:Arylsulfatase n=1 Tax=Flammeovirga kamogawensis TaxID=373891 RepID=A0ABX8H3M5_9BACT|nr:arylsulfatase [Flammeovirga kamogawensis]MBB6461890.1 arylsulfatase A-like enzyme [Flammeovirga kamogawensis]QWG10498.1 arylsulfatase [Flammeovirga kamogawensis]TRX63608.1 arylsulfatase [Flammeovirga kamogawensis]
MRKLVITSLLFCLSCTLFAQQKPNVIVILADDLGSGDLSFRGSHIQTPAIDRMAENGLVLDNFYVHPVCTPTRAALMTGKYAMHLGFQSGVIRTWEALLPDRGLPVGERTIAEEFNDAGYNTLAFGKWHLGESQKEFMPWNRGFDYFYGHLTGHIDYFTKEHAGGYDWRRNKEIIRDNGYSTYLIADDVVDQIEKSDKKKPFFMYVAFNAPHTPLQAPEEAQLPYKDLPESKRIYSAMVSEMDKGIGEILTALEEKGILENTVLFFTSDNGGVATKSTPSSNGTLRGTKGELFQGGVLVPGIVMWKGKIKAAHSREMMHVVDLYPTLTSLTGVKTKVPQDIDGLDCSAFLFEGEKSVRKEVVPNILRARGAVIVGDWKLIRNPKSKTQKGPLGEEIDGDEYLLCNIKKDPSEKVNLVKKEKKKFKELKKILEEREASQVKAFKRLKQPDQYQVPEIWGDENAKMLEYHKGQ